MMGTGGSITFSAADHDFMARALELAARGLNTATPNPRVGCVLARNGQIVGEGWHQKAGEPHAESYALSQAGEAARGATVYVTLEPCSHFGRTPPCADALIAAGVARVVAAMEDPNPQVAGDGVTKLRAAAIETSVGLMATEATELNLGFVSRMCRGRPWLRLKLATSLDGRTALNNGRSQWITGPDARRDAHAWRARSCAILTGIGTVRDDDPSLTVRDVPCTRQPLRVIVDSRLDISPTAKVLADTGALVFTAAADVASSATRYNRRIEVISLPNTAGKVDLTAMLGELGRRGINELLVEGGHRLNGALLAENLVDELLIYQAPILLGDKARGMFDLPELTDLSGRRELRIVDRRQVGSDTRLLARLA
jgi:diaminohydroxyphosphoribosylaminopyrimidine deaminase/5-amino-6-(5-phosphoribosylamino)uracil reductase